MIATLFQNPKAPRIKRRAKFTMSVVAIAKHTRLTRKTPVPTRRLKPIGSPRALALPKFRHWLRGQRPMNGPNCTTAIERSQANSIRRLVVWAHAPGQNPLATPSRGLVEPDEIAGGLLILFTES